MISLAILAFAAEHKEIPMPTTDFSYLAIQKSNYFTQCYTFLVAPFNDVVIVMSMPEPITYYLMSLQNHIRLLRNNSNFSLTYG